jgi:hypothetical protein
MSVRGRATTLLRKKLHSLANAHNPHFPQAWQLNAARGLEIVIMCKVQTAQRYTVSKFKSHTKSSGQFTESAISGI